VTAHDPIPELIRDAIARHKAGDWAGADLRYRDLLAKLPQHVELWAMFAQLAEDTGNKPAAAAILPKLQAAAGTPQRLLLAQAQAARFTGAISRAAELFQQLAAADPAGIEGLFHLANMLHDEDQPEAAEAALRECLARQPQNPGPWRNLGALLYERGRAAESIAAFRAAIARGLNSPDMQGQLGLALLQAGRLDEGWRCYEGRLSEAAVSAGRNYSAAQRWDGRKDPPGKLIVWGEQGVGDEIRFSSLFPDILARLGPERVTVAADSRLHPLFAASFPGLALVPHGGATGTAAHIAAGSLAGIFRRRLADFPARPAFLAIPPERSQEMAAWLQSVAPGAQAIGLAWRSGAALGARSKLYPAAADLAPLLDLPGAVFVLVQYDATREEISLLNQLAPGRFFVHPSLDLRNDFLGTGALMQNLAAIVTADTAVKDLACGLGRPALVLAHGYDWTGLGGPGDAFYRTKVTFRREPGTPWSGLMQAVRAHVLGLMEGQKAG